MIGFIGCHDCCRAGFSLSPYNTVSSSLFWDFGIVNLHLTKGCAAVRRRLLPAFEY